MVPVFLQLDNTCLFWVVIVDVLIALSEVWALGQSYVGPREFERSHMDHPDTPPCKRAIKDIYRKYFQPRCGYKVQ